MGTMKVAVIGAGANLPFQFCMVYTYRLYIGVTSLVTLKNLREEGFEAQCFESKLLIGGVWSFTEEDETSILECTSDRTPPTAELTDSQSNNLQQE